MIVFDHVSFSYPGSDPVLEDISFHIKPGEQVGLIGANGIGKSTILKIMLGLLRAEGKVEVTGLPMEQANLGKIRKKLGFVLQDSDNQMFMPTVLEDMVFGPMNYGLSRKDAEQKAEEVLASLGISHLKDRHNHRISGGEKRMAAIATILAMEPEAMLMDEPSAALDPKNRRVLIRTLNSLPVTKIITSHDLDLILETCERVILLGDGKIAADGPADVILRDKALLEANDLELPLCLTGRMEG